MAVESEGFRGAANRAAVDAEPAGGPQRGSGGAHDDGLSHGSGNTAMSERVGLSELLNSV